MRNSTEIKKNEIVPESVAVGFLFDVLSARGDVGALERKYRRKTSRAGTEVMVFRMDEDSYSLSITRKRRGRQGAVSTSTYGVEIGNLKKLARDNDGVQKWFMIFLNQIGQNILANVMLLNDAVTFPLQPYVDNGMYSRLDNAVRGFFDAYDVLSTMKIFGVDLLLDQDTKGYLFYSRSVTGGVATLYVNRHLNWGAICKYNMFFPQIGYTFSRNGFLLFRYICQQIRQRKKEVTQKGVISIPLKSVHAELFLPDVHEDHPQRRILDKITAAVDEINTATKEGYINSTELSLDYDASQSVAGIIATGNLVVSVSGTMAMHPELVMKKQVAEIEKEEKKEIAVEAKAKLLKERKKRKPASKS